MNLFFSFFSQAILWFMSLLTFIFFTYSVLEKEKRASLRSLPALVVIIVLSIINSFGWFSITLQTVFVIFPFLTGIVLTLPFGNKKVSFQIPEVKYDERDIVFSRKELINGTDKFDKYYKNQPQNRYHDDLFRAEPGLLNKGAKFYNALQFNAAKATFSSVDLLQPLVEKKVGISEKVKTDRDNISQFLKKWTIKLGAVNVGFTLLQPHYVYSHVGRGENYGSSVKLDHKYAIAFTVEMSHESLKYTPKGPIIMESAQQYLNAGAIAIQVSQFIRNLGYDARAHIDTNYQLICPIVAQDAGLGTIGRMGLLMTPNLGARVRIGVVTTNLEINVNNKPLDSSVIHFCELCKKCAVNCPSNAISKDSAKSEKVWQPWKINQEKCYTYWCKVGTDCGRCITVCPYSHPNNFIHNIIRWGIKRNQINRWLALKLDDYFYSGKPPVKKLEDWMIIEKG